MDRKSQENDRVEIIPEDMPENFLPVAVEYATCTG